MAIARWHEAKFLAEIWKHIEFSKTEEDLIQEQNQYIKLNESGMSHYHS
jgi:predicted metal-dependent RNase